MSRPRVSVCMATYQGARHLGEQVASILAELGPDDELVVADDASTDGTLDVLASFADARIRVLESPSGRNAGHVATFERAVAAATGDVLLLADQDDLWPAGRVDLLLAGLARRPVVAGNVTLVGDASGPAHHPLSGATSGSRWRNLGGILTGTRGYFGSAMGLRREVVDAFLPIPDHVESHDVWLAILGAVGRGTEHVEEVVLMRRVHDSNLSLPRRPVPVLVAVRWHMLRQAAEASRRLRVGARVRTRTAGGRPLVVRPGTTAPAADAPDAPTPDVEVVMAAFEGGPYLDAQVLSILDQTVPCRLTLRDDCSSDDTFERAQQWERRAPDRVRATRRATPSGSAQRNFLEVLAGATGEYVMLSDDDDVWDPDKVAVTLAAMRALEARHPAGTPLLVHTDLRVVGPHLEPLAPSLLGLQQLDAAGATWRGRLLQNAVTGCTVMVNRALLERLRVPDEGVRMHDWWLALVAASFGGIAFVDRATVSYRQHGRNTVGARDTGRLRYLLGRLAGPEARADTAAAVVQAAAFLATYHDDLGPAQRAVLADLATWPSLGKAGRIRLIARHGLWKGSLARRLGQVWTA